MADRSLASPSSTRLDFHNIDAVLALHRPIQRNLGVVGSTTIPAVPVSDEALHEALSFSPNAGDGRVPFGGRGPSEGIGGEAYHAAGNEPGLSFGGLVLFHYREMGEQTRRAAPIGLFAGSPGGPWGESTKKRGPSRGPDGSKALAHPLLCYYVRA
jgi:hypothetical protein